MKISVALTALLSGFALASSMQAGSLASPCTTNTLAFYETLNSDHECSVGILNFLNFTFTSTGNGANEAATDIMVTPLGDQSRTGIGGGFTFGLENPNNLPLAPHFMVGLNQTATYDIGYHFDIDPAPIAEGADLGMDPPFGNVSITQSFCLDSSFGTNNFSGTSQNAGLVCRGGDRTFAPQTFSVDDTNPPTSFSTGNSWVNHLNFNPPAQNFGNVLTEIKLDGTGLPGGSGFDSVSGTTTVVSAAPEPSTLVLALAGLLIAGVRRRMKFQS